MVSDRLKKIIFKKLYKDLSKVEIIPYEGSVWFINRENKYWYFEFCDDGYLWWRYSFFVDFFELFSLDENDFEPIIGEWVEEILNCEISKTNLFESMSSLSIDEVLNCKVLTVGESDFFKECEVDEVLNSKILTVERRGFTGMTKLEDVLNSKTT